MAAEADQEYTHIYTYIHIYLNIRIYIAIHVYTWLSLAYLFAGCCSGYGGGRG